MATDPEELLRSIERTREELANTVDTIAGRLDPKRAAKRGVDAVRDGVTSVVDGARVKLRPTFAGSHTVESPTGEADDAARGSMDGPAATANATPASASALAAMAKAHTARLAAVAKAKAKAKPTAAGVAALVALAAVLAARRRR